MTDFYTCLAATAARLLTSFGPVEGILCRETGGHFDKVRGLLTSSTTREQTVRGVRLVANDTNVLSLDERVGETLTPAEVTLFKIAAEGLDFDIALGQALVIDGRELPIVGLSRSRPADVTLLYTVAVRR